MYVSFIGIALLSCLVLGRAFYIQRFQGSYWRSMSDSMHQRFVSLDAERGTIYSEDGQMLSTSLPQFNIYLDFMADGLRDKGGKVFKENIDSFSVAVAGLLGDKSAVEYKKEFQAAYKKKERYHLLKKKLSFEEYKTFRDFPLVRLGKNKSGVITEVKTFRKNPYAMMAKRTIGLYRENAQVIGLERTYDTTLKGKSGKRLVRYITGGVPVPVEGYEIDPENGKDVKTTIDVNIQDIAETALHKQMETTESQYGTCIVMETKTGKIKAIANLGKRPDGSYDEDYNYAMLTTEPGSTIKLATLLSVLSEGKTTINSMVEVGSAGRAYVGVRDVNEAERMPKPVMTVRECFAHSSNVGMSKIAFQAFSAQPDKYLSYLHKFHMDSVTGIDLMGEDRPRLPKIKRSNEGLHAMVTASFGYAIEVSPLQTLSLYNTIANGGKMMRPYLVNSIESNGTIVKKNEPKVVAEQLVSPEIVGMAKQCMESVVTEGTGKNAFKGLPFAVAGKTGTAHVADGNIKYGDGVYQATFVGYFPANQPQYTCIVLIRSKPHAALHYGGTLAAPVFREIATKLYAMYIEKKEVDQYAAVKDSSAYFYAGYSPDIKNVYKTLHVSYTDSVSEGSWSNVYPANYQPMLRTNNVRKQVMPNVKGMGLKDALYLLENMGLKVQVKGRGKVLAQSIAPGTALVKSNTVMLELAS